MFIYREVSRLLYKKFYFYFTLDKNNLEKSKTRQNPKYFQKGRPEPDPARNAKPEPDPTRRVGSGRVGSGRVAYL